MLNINALTTATLKKSPFKYSTIYEFLPPSYADDLLKDLPSAGNYKSTRSSGSDKTYQVVNNILLAIGDSEYNKVSEPSPIWIECIEQLHGAAYRTALSTLLDTDVTQCPMEITLKRYRHEDYISAHTDKECIRATHMIFLNDTWEAPWGGLLHFLTEDQRDFESFLPSSNTSVAFVRADNSWHRVCPMNKKGKERIALQVAFWNQVDRIVAPGRSVQAIYD